MRPTVALGLGLSRMTLACLCREGGFGGLGDVCNSMVVGIYAMRMRMAFFCVRVLVVSVGMTAVSVSVIVEEEETDDVGSKAKGTDNEHKLRMRYLLRLDKSLDGFEEDRKAESHKEDTIDKSAKRLSALPLLVVSMCAESVNSCFLPRMCMSLSYSAG